MPFTIPDYRFLFGGGINSALNERLTGTIDGVNATFGIANKPKSGGILLWINGILQCPGADADYVLTNQTIVFNPPSIPQAGDRLLAAYGY